MTCLCLLRSWLSEAPAAADDASNEAGALLGEVVLNCELAGEEVALDLLLALGVAEGERRGAIAKIPTAVLGSLLGQ